MRIKRSSIVVLSLLVIALAVPAFVFAGGKAESKAGSTASKYEMVLITKIADPWFVNMEEGLNQANTEYGIHAVKFDPSAYDPALQVKACEDMIAKGVNAILITPDDAKSLEPVFAKARAKGIAVVTNESPNQVNADFDVEMVDNVQYGEAGMEYLVKAMGNSGKYVIMVGSLTVPNHNIWADAGIALAKKKYPNMVQATDRIPAETIDVAREKALEILKAYPDVKGFICWGSQGAPGVCQAIREKGLIGKVHVVGGTTPSQGREYLKDGSFDYDVMYSPKWGAYTAAYIAKMVLDKKAVTDGIVVPNVGKGKLSGTNLVVHNILLITKENVDQFNF
jgi:simple sugar transport system substrate-binding protein